MKGDTMGNDEVGYIGISMPLQFNEILISIQFQSNGQLICFIHNSIFHSKYGWYISSLDIYICNNMRIHYFK